MPIFEAMNRFVRKFKKLQIRQIDAAALICIALWADGWFNQRIHLTFCSAEKMDIDSLQIQEHKERVLAEWMLSLSVEHGEIEAGLRMAKMLCFLVDLDVSFE
jgi:hypothetical protein